jgi:hypothetical protein
VTAPAWPILRPTISPLAALTRNAEMPWLVGCRDGLGDLGDTVHDLVEAVAPHEQARARDTALPVVEEDRVRGALDRAGLGVVEHGVGVLAASRRRPRGTAAQVAGV